MAFAGANNSDANLWSLFLDGAAHHLDLRFPDPADPASVVAARAFMLEFARKVVQVGGR